MATAQPNSTNPLDKLSFYLAQGQHSVWDRFSPDQQRQMVEDDLAAGRSVSLVLAALITAGMLMSIGSMVLILALS
jgi:hypothetical protein